MKSKDFETAIGLCRIFWGVNGITRLVLAIKYTTEISFATPKEIEKVIALIKRHLSGQRVSYNKVLLDLCYLPKFTSMVLQKTREIPYGVTITYKKLAESIGRPNAVRAVARALSVNPIPLIIPCHRVIGTDGELKGYSGGGGIYLKRRLLEIEGVFAPPGF